MSDIEELKKGPAIWNAYADANIKADLTWCPDLRGADLRGADLRGVYLRGADLRGAHLEGADLEGADLEGVEAGLIIPTFSLNQKARVAVAVRGECYNQSDFGNVCGTTGCLAFHIVKQADGGEVFAAWFRSIPFAAMLIWPEAAHLFYQTDPKPVIEFTEQFMPKDKA